MKILIANDYITKIGGAEAYAWNLKTELEKKRHVVEMFGSHKTLSEYFISQKNKSILSYFKKVFNVHALIKFSKRVHELQPDIIHMHNIYNELSPSILMASKRIPVVMTVHDNMLVNAVSILSDRSGKECKKRTCGGCRNCVGWKGAIYEFVKRKIHKQLLKKVRLYITPSKYMGDLIKEAGFGPVEVIPNGIKLFEYSKITNYNTLLYVGRLTKEKGVEYLLRAMPEIIKSFPDVKLNLVGDGPDKEYFKDLAEELKIMKNVNFVGSVEKKNIEQYYKDATIVVVPSIYPDNFPTVCIEAMSLGRPIIGTGMGGIPELIAEGKTGLLVSHSNSQILANKIKYLLANKDLVVQMSENCVKRSSQYSLNKHIDNIENKYKEYIK